MNRNLKRIAIAAGIGVAAALLTACHSMATAPDRPPLELASSVDIPRFMGDWYVIAAIPTFIEKDAFGSKESYRLDAEGRIVTTFTFHEGAAAGPLREYHSKATVLQRSGAVWGQQYIWPVKADYRISYVAPDYSQTVITREKRDYVWIMARTPTIAAADLDRLIAIAVRQGYDAAMIVRVPQPL